MPGLAHFCEHLLFMVNCSIEASSETGAHILKNDRARSSSRKRTNMTRCVLPNFSGAVFDVLSLQYLTRNNGDSNAFTTGSDTTFYFSVASNALQGALERFSAFFHSPLFSESCVMRELNAIDSENSSFLQDDDWRVRQVIYSLARPGHPLRRSGIGNKKTLMKGARSGKVARRESSSRDGRSGSSRGTHTKNNGDAGEKNIGLEIRRRVIQWWKKEYCAGRMSLAIVGKGKSDLSYDLSPMILMHLCRVPRRAYSDGCNLILADQEQGTKSSTPCPRVPVWEE